MTVIHRITGYDKRTERLAVEHDIPPEAFEEVRRMAAVSEMDPEAIGSYPLTARTAADIGSRLRKAINIDLYDWFMEPFSEV